MILDTHVLIWWADDSMELSRRARSLLTDMKTPLQWSSASTWEMAIKVGRGKLRLPEPVRDYVVGRLDRLGIESVLVEHHHAARVADLPPHHADPFDRLLVAQAQIFGVPILSVDEKLRAYDVEVIW